MRKVLIEARPERRTLMTEDRKARRVKPEQGKLDFDGTSMSQTAAAMVIDTEALLGFTPWFSAAGAMPPSRGWYEIKGPGPFPELINRLWFEKVGRLNDGSWHAAAGMNEVGAFVVMHSDMPNDTVWRGLAAVWPWGYRWDLDKPGAKRYRAQLLQAA